jgi:uncharacterized protein (TIGR00369 family)
VSEALDNVRGEPRRSELGGELRSKLVTWEASPRTAELAGQVSGLEYLQGIVDGRMPPPPYADLVGAELVEVGDGTAVFVCTPDEATLNIAGIAHGGLLASLMDFASGCALQSLQPPGTATATVEMKVNYMTPLGVGQRVEVRGRVVKAGRRIAFIEVEARTERDLIGTASTTMVVQRVGSDSSTRVR